MDDKRDTAINAGRLNIAKLYHALVQNAEASIANIVLFIYRKKALAPKNTVSKHDIPTFIHDAE